MFSKSNSLGEVGQLGWKCCAPDSSAPMDFPYSGGQENEGRAIVRREKPQNFTDLFLEDHFGLSLSNVGVADLEIWTGQ